ncbi:MAG TPA: hypothetical protein VIM67_07935, partial [Terriglobus sp.]
MKEEEPLEIFLDAPTKKIGHTAATSDNGVSYELRMRLWLGLLGVAILGLTAAVLHMMQVDGFTSVTILLVLTIVWFFLAERAFHRIVTPLQTLTNVIAAIRAEDFSFRVRGARRGDAAGDLAMEINLLSESLQRQ